MRARRWASDAARALTVTSGEPDPVEAMVQAANALLDEADVSGPPAPLPVLASFQGIREIQRVAMRPSGRLIVQPGGSIVQVNVGDSPARQNFTIAHEIAHTFFPAFQARPRDIVDQHTGDYPADDEEEHLCDIGAAALLLPERWLRPAAGSLPPSLGSLEQLAREFRTSLEATARAVARLDIWPFALVFWEEGWRKAERTAIDHGEPPVPPALRVTRAIMAPSFDFYIPRNKSIGEESSVYRAFKTKTATQGVDRLTIGAVTAEVQAESAYHSYLRDGILRTRVISFLTRSDNAAQLNQAG